MKQLLKMNLQFFSEQGTDDNSEPTDNQQGEQTEDTGQSEKTFTQDEVEKMVKDRLARAEKKAAEKIEEAAKLAKMNEQDKKDYEHQKVLEELETLRKKDEFHSMSKEASSMLSEHSINANDEILSIVVKETAEDTQNAVNAFVDIVNKTAEATVNERLKGSTPKISVNTDNSISRESFEKMTYSQKQDLAEKNPEQYKQLLKG